MTPAPFRWAMRSNLTQIRHVTPVRPGAATGVVARVYADTEREFGLLAPPIALHSPEPALLAASWLLLRETVLAAGTVSRAEKEAVAAGVSLANDCPYCVEVHGAVLGGVHGRTDATAISSDRIGDVVDPGLRAVAAWARTASTADGPPPPELSAGQVTELLGVHLAFEYLNRMVGIYLGTSPLPSGLSPAAAGFAAAMLGRMLRPTAERALEPGASLDLLPAADLPADLSWAVPRPTLALALARAVAAVESAGRRVLAPSVRGIVLAELAARDGRPPQLGDDWITRAVSGLEPGSVAAARLALRTAVSPHLVDDATVAEFRLRNSGDGDPGDGSLLAATAWASMAAARRATARAVGRAPHAGRGRG